MSITQETTEIARTTVQNVHVHARMLSQNVAPDIQLPFQSCIINTSNVHAHISINILYCIYISHTANTLSEFVLFFSDN